MACKPAISSHSLGRAWVHDMRTKLDQASKYGFDIELFHEDLQYMAKHLPGRSDREKELSAAENVRILCQERNIEIVSLQPFMHYEGLRDRDKHARRLDEMKFWIELAHRLHTNIIAVPSTFLPKDELDATLIVKDLRELADAVAPSGIQLAYESLAWGTFANTWEDSWRIVTEVDRPNFKLCLDTFNIAARVYANPSVPSQKTPDANADMTRSLERLVKAVDPTKIAYIQVVDAEFLSEPLSEGHELYDPEHKNARMSWSRGCRLFYGEEDRGAFLPIKQILTAVLNDLGFRGCISAELFNRSLEDADSRVPSEHAKRAHESWNKIVQEFSLNAST